MPSNRKLIADGDRERKREQDRMYQRRKRDRDRKLISTLKARIESIEGGSTSAADASLPSASAPSAASAPTAPNFAPHGASQAPPMLHLDPSQTTNDPLSGAPIAWMGMHHTRGRVVDAEDSDVKMPLHLSTAVLPDDGRPSYPYPSMPDSAIPAQPADLASSMFTEAALAGDSALVPRDLNIPSLSAIHPLPVRWTILNQLLQTASAGAIRQPEHFDSSEFDAHIIISGVLHGWDSVSHIFKSTAIWNALRGLDEMSLAWSGPAERMVALKTVAMLLRHQSSKHAQPHVPAFLQPRPSQVAISHPKLIDYFIWPGFRERMVFGFQEYSYEGFARNFSQALRFVWPGTPRTAYTKAPESSLYRFSDEFLKYCLDIRCHRLDHDFLAMHPQFYGDVPVAGSIPINMDMPDDGYGWAFEDDEAQRDPTNQNIMTPWLPSRLHDQQMRITEDIS